MSEDDPCTRWPETRRRSRVRLLCSLLLLAPSLPPQRGHRELAKGGEAATGRAGTERTWRRDCVWLPAVAGGCVATGCAWMPVDTSTPLQTQQFSQSYPRGPALHCTGKHSHSLPKWKALSNLSASSEGTNYSENS